MLRRLGMGLATSVLVTGCAASPDRVPEPIKTVSVMQEVPIGANFYEEPPSDDRIKPCGATVVKLTVEQTRLKREYGQNYTMEYLGFPQPSVFPEASHPNPQYSCQSDKDGIIWASTVVINLPPQH